MDIVWTFGANAYISARKHEQYIPSQHSGAQRTQSCLWAVWVWQTWHGWHGCSSASLRRKYLWLWGTNTPHPAEPRYLEGCSTEWRWDMGLSRSLIKKNPICTIDNTEYVHWFSIFLWHPFWVQNMVFGISQLDIQWQNVNIRKKHNCFPLTGLSMSSMQGCRSRPKSMKFHSMPSLWYSSCSRMNMVWLNSCCRRSLV